MRLAAALLLLIVLTMHQPVLAGFAAVMMGEIEPGGAIAPAAHRAGDPSDWSPSVSSKAAIDYRKGESE